MFALTEKKTLQVFIIEQGLLHIKTLHPITAAKEVMFSPMAFFLGRSIGFVSRITRKPPKGFPRNLAGGRVSAQRGTR